MRVASYVLALSLALPGAAIGESSARGTALSAMPGGEAIGRLMMSGKSMCTGAMVEPDLVVTAAHCLYDTRTGKRLKPEKIKFEAGLKSGKASATRHVVSATQHPQYRHNRKGQAQMGYDLALLKLNKPIHMEQTLQISSASRPEKGDMLGVVSYTIGHKNDPRFAYPCQVLARKGETLVMSCQVNFGASGAPVLAMQNGREPFLVSVISAKAAMGGRKVSVGTALTSNTLKQIMAEG